MNLQTSSEPCDKESGSLIAAWAKTHPEIQRVFLYGSRIRGNHRLDSDLDVAVEIEAAENDSDAFTTWMCDQSEWTAELQRMFPYKIHLEWHDLLGTTPTISKGLEDGSQLVFQKKDLKTHHR